MLAVGDTLAVACQVVASEPIGELYYGSMQSGKPLYANAGPSKTTSIVPRCSYLSRLIRSRATPKSLFGLKRIPRGCCASRQIQLKHSLPSKWNTGPVDLPTLALDRGQVVPVENERKRLWVLCLTLPHTHRPTKCPLERQK